MGIKAVWTFFFNYYYYFSLSWEDEYKEKGGWRNFGGKGGMVRMEGEGQKRLTTNCGDLDFVVRRKKKKVFFCFFSLVFFYYLILLFCCYRFITVLFTV